MFNSSNKSRTNFKFHFQRCQAQRVNTNKLDRQDEGPKRQIQNGRRSGRRRTDPRRAVEPYEGGKTA